MRWFSFFFDLDRFENVADIALWQMPIFRTRQDQILVFLAGKMGPGLESSEIDFHGKRLFQVTIKKNVPLFTLI